MLVDPSDTSCSGRCYLADALEPWTGDAVHSLWYVLSLFSFFLFGCSVATSF